VNDRGRAEASGNKKRQESRDKSRLKLSKLPMMTFNLARIVLTHLVINDSNLNSRRPIIESFYFRGMFQNLISFLLA
jgi:hypothetical protein